MGNLGQHVLVIKMTPRERVLSSVAHRQPDRVPVDLGSTPSSGISAIAYNNLKGYLGVEHGATRVYDVVQQLAQPEDVILDRFGIDVLDIGRTFNTLDVDWYDITLSDGSLAQYPKWFRPIRQPDGSYSAFTAGGTLIAKMPVAGAFFDQTCFPYVDGYPADYKDLGQAMSKVLWAALVHSPWDSAGAVGFWDTLRERALALRQSSDRALVVVAGCNLFEWGAFLRRMDNFLMDIYVAPAEVEKLLDALMAQHLVTLEKICASVGDIVDIIRFGDDLGMDSAPFIAPEVYRRLFKPRHKRLCEYVKKHSRMCTLLHSCGSIYKLMPDLIEAGYDIINPVQTNCADMEPQRLKQDFGRDITFWGGGCDTCQVLNCGTPAEVRAHVLERMDIFAPGGGFVFSTVHNILPEVPPENIVAVFGAIKEFEGG
jgi:uroporphyrinogen decarboxylase